MFGIASSLEVPLLVEFTCMAWVEGFLARMSQAQEADGGNKEQARFDKKFAAVEPSYGRVFQVGIGEEAMPEERGGCEINREVKRLPKAAAEAETEIRSGNDEGKQIDSDGADRVIEGLAWRIDRVNEIEKTETRIFIKEQNCRMKDSEGERNVPGPIVKAEIIESVMWPGAVGAVAEGHEQTQEHVQGDGADSEEADVCRKIQDSYAHGKHGIRNLSSVQLLYYDVRASQSVWMKVNLDAVLEIAASWGVNRMPVLG
jgi:hypothetical protein